MLTDREANALASEFVARKIRQRVHDPVVAEKLIPKNHGFGTRRVPLETGYYEVYNQPNVELVDLNETPIERITPRGIRTSEREHAFDYHLRHRLRRHHRRLRPDRHPRHGRRAAEGGVERRPADLSRCLG
jgi:cation diffusion facilitator CzcD-associated flavoprotein CzcO